MFISRTNINNRLKRIREILKHMDVRLVADNKIGIQLVGNEENIRNLYTKYILNLKKNELNDRLLFSDDNMAMIDEIKNY